MEEKKKTGTKGNVAYISLPTAEVPIYSLNDILYLYSRTSYIKKLNKFLINLYGAKDKEINFKEFFLKNKIDWSVGTTIKDLGYVDENYKWKNEYPSQKHSIQLALVQWKKNKIKKSSTK